MNMATRVQLLVILGVVGVAGGLMIAAGVQAENRAAEVPTQGRSIPQPGPPPTPTLLPDEEWKASWHQTPQPYGGWVIGFNDEGDHVVVRECRYTGGSTTSMLECTDWVVMEQAHWKWLKRELSRTMKW